MKLFTKESLIEDLHRIRKIGWIENRRKGNDGGVGNTLEDLLGITENNLPLPNAGEWEIKGRKKDTTSLITLFHMEPSPRACKFVPSILLPLYGWPHNEAGRKYPHGERSFRQTITCGNRTNRGFTVIVNRNMRRVEVSFDQASVDKFEHKDWFRSVQSRVGIGELNPMPYWGFDDLFHTAGTKMLKAIYAVAERKKENGVEYFRYTNFYMLEGFSQENFLNAIESGTVLVDFDARTGHNHGTKFRLRQNCYTDLYESVKEV